MRRIIFINLWVIFITVVLNGGTVYAKGFTKPFPLALMKIEPDTLAPYIPFSTPDSFNIKINHDATTQVQNEEQIWVNPKNPDNLVAIWRDFRLGYRRVGHGYSDNGGRSWTDELFSGTPYPWHSDPGLTVDTSGNFYAVILSYLSSAPYNGLFVYKSTDGGVSWGPPVTVVDSFYNAFEDKELITCDRSNTPYNGNLYVTWTRFDYNTNTTHIKCSRSTNGGQSFVRPPVNVSDLEGVQWPVPAVGPNGEVYIAWVDYNYPRITFDKSTDGGVTFGTDIGVQSVNGTHDYINGDILVFPFPAMDVDITGGPYNGYIYMAYMDYGVTDTEIKFTRSTNGGNTWSSPIRLNDDPQGNGCDQFHPWTFVDRDETINVIFYDRRNDPGNLLMDVYLTQSTDGGATWSSNQRVTTVSSDPTAGQLKAGLLGEYIGVTAFNGRVHPVWTDTRLGNQDVFTARIEPIPFAPAVNYDAGYSPWSVFCADLDRDSDLDLAVGHHYSNNVSILRNNGEGTFQTKADYGTGSAPVSVFCADLDRDSDLDLAVANGDISILKNNEDGTFQPKVDYVTPGSSRSVFCADLDGDDDLDLATANAYTTNNVSILKNKGEGTFQLDSNYTAGDDPISIFCADLDGDLDLDLAVANEWSGNVSVLKNKGDGTFQSAVNYVVGDYPASVFCADLDRDSDLDLVVGKFGPANNVSILKNNGNGTFQPKVDYSAGISPVSVFCADLDGDTDLDLAAANSGLVKTSYTTVSIFKNNGNGTFQPKADYGAGTSNVSVFCADLDADSDLDLAVASYGSDSVYILENLSQVPANQPPNPFSLLSPADGDSVFAPVTLDWQTPYDPNFGDQIRYDLYVSTVPDFDPDSTTIYDSLCISRLTLNLDIKNYYYWKVKAYDNWGAEVWSIQTWSFYVSLRGDVNGDGVINSADVVYLINHLFIGGPAPVPWAAGDVNCDGGINTTDVVYLINYLFISGPPPCS